MKKILIGLLALTAGIVLGVATIVKQPQLVSASKAAKVIKTTNLKNTKVHMNKGTLYSSDKLTKVNWSASDFENITFTRYSQAEVKKSNGKKAVYQYVKVGTVHGWIWRGYVKSGAASLDNKISSANLKAYDTQFVKSLNTRRALHGAPALKLNATMSKYAVGGAYDGWVAINTFQSSIPLDPELGVKYNMTIKAETEASLFDPGSSKKSVWINEAKTDVSLYFDKKDGHFYTNQQKALLNKSYTTIGVGVYTDGSSMQMDQNYN